VTKKNKPSKKGNKNYKHKDLDAKDAKQVKGGFQFGPNTLKID
jgi:hypothetical protein